MLYLKELLGFKLLLPYAIGIITWWSFPHSFQFPVWYLLAFLPVLYLSSKQKEISPFSQISSIFVLFAFLFFSGYQSAKINQSDLAQHPDFTPGQIYAYGKVLSIKEKNTPQYIVRLLQVERVKTNFRTSTHEKIVVFDPVKTDKYFPGDYIFFTANLYPVKPPTQIEEFDFRKYYRAQGIHFNAWMTYGILQKRGLLFPIFRLSEQWSLVIQNAFSEKTGGLLKAMVLGRKNGISDDIVEVFRKSGAIHVLAISGLHVGIILGICMFLFNTIFGLSRKSKLISQLLSLLCIWTFALIAGWQIPVVRTASLLTLYIFGRRLNRDIHPVHTLTIGVFILLLFEPMMIFQVSFQFSSLAVLGIIVCYRRIFSALTIPGYYWLNPVLKMFSVSLAAQVFLFPLILYYFGQFPIYFWLSSLVAIPLTALLLISSFAWGFLYWISWPDGIGWATQFLEYLANQQISWLESISELPSSLLSNLHVDGIQTLILLSIMVLVSWPFRTNKRWNLKMVPLFTMCLIAYSSWNILDQNEKVSVYLAHHQDGVHLQLKDQLTIYDYQVKTNKSGKVSLYDLKNHRFLPDQFQNQVLFRNKHFLQFRNYTIVIDPQYINADLKDLQIDLALFTRNPNSDLPKSNFKKLITDFHYSKNWADANLIQHGYQIITL